MASPHTQVLGSMKAGGVIHIPPPHGIPTRRMRKRANAVKNSATGKSKALLPTPIQRVLAKRSRCYRRRGAAAKPTGRDSYSNWSEAFDGKKQAGKKGGK